MVYRDTRTDDPVHETRPARRAHAVRRRRWSLGRPGPGMILGLIGAFGILLSLFTAWWDPGVHANDVSLRFLFDSGTSSHHPSLLLALIPLFALALIGALMAGGGVLRVVAGIGTLLVVVLFAVQVRDVVGSGDAFEALDLGVYFAAVGGLLSLVSGLVPTWQRRTADTVDLR